MEHDIGSKIKAARLEKKLTQEQFYEILAEDAANVYIQDLPSFVALNKKYGGSRSAAAVRLDASTPTTVAS